MNTQNIVITGANRGIGFQLVKQYAKLPNTFVLAGVRHPSRAKELILLQSKYNNIKIIALDLTSQTSMDNFSDTINGPISILINCGGIFGPKNATTNLAIDFLDPAITINKQEWLNVFEVNTIGPFLLTKTLGKHFAKESKIIMISSRFASLTDNTNGGCYLYRISKAALNMIGRSLAADLKSQSISVGMIHPGWVQTDMGGARADITAETSAAGIIDVIEHQLCLTTSGTFFNYDGSIRAW